MPEFRVQDPETAQGSLLEAIVELAEDGWSCKWLFAFASLQGINMLFAERPVQRLAGEGQIDLLVGVSAITDRAALERLDHLQTQYHGLSVRAFWDQIGEKLFHPKACTFEYRQGGAAMLVGSGNLTPGGLRNNYEAFSVHRSANGDNCDTTELDAFLTNNAAHIFAVDNPLVLARAGQNVRRNRRPGGGRGAEEGDIALVPEPDAEPDELVLVAYAPKSRGGWAQLQLNLDVLADFFNIPAAAGEPLRLQERRPDNTLGPLEDRVLVYPATTNQNVRIELAAAHGRGYPPDGHGRPIVLFRDQGARMFEYIVLEPGNDGHAELTIMLEAAPDSIGRGVTRVLRPIPAVRRVWMDCPW